MEAKKDNLIHVRIAARQYGLPVKWLKQQAQSGVIPALIADGQVLFDADILAEWLSQQARTKNGGQADE